MSDWDILLRLASAPGWREATYGGGGGPVAGNPMGTASIPTSGRWNCSTFQAKSGLMWAPYLLGRRGYTFGVDHWSKAMIQELGGPGGVAVAVECGLADRMCEGLPRRLTRGAWIIAQGWNGNRGHAFFLNVAAGGLAYLEANNGYGVNGIGSRSCPTVPNARNWGGMWPAGALEPESADDVARRYETLYTATLI